MKKHLSSVVSLSVICIVIAVLLAVTNYITAPIIKKQEDAAANQALIVVFPNGEGFEKVDIADIELPSTVTEAYSEKSGGYVFKLTTSGYASNLIIMCGVDSNGNVTGADVIASSETLGAENGYGDNFVEKSIDTVDSVDTISGATKTTGAYRNAVKDALNAFTVMKGGSVDLRSEEEILNDNLTAALPKGQGNFSSVFITEIFDDISAVYKAENGKGYVFLIDETFVGVDENGNVVSDVDDETKAAVTDVAEKIVGATVSEIDIAKYDEMPTNVLKAYKTSSGNYIFELRAAGYGINGEWHTSGEYINLRVSATPDGKIISCVTISQKESEGIGDACANPEFYTQFNGKDKESYSDIDAISGATITTNGYKAAVAKVFDAIEILKGDA